MDSVVENTSGQGAAAVVPEEIKRWNWGAFLLNWIWSIGNQTWIGLLSLVPYVGFIMAIVLGVKGSEWAWRNRRWESVQQFKEVQRIWAMWGVGILVASFLIALFAAILFPVLARVTQSGP